MEPCVIVAIGNLEVNSLEGSSEIPILKKLDFISSECGSLNRIAALTYHMYTGSVRK
jgi:hypothetical protein